jgi:hypothetical protein
VEHNRDTNGASLNVTFWWNDDGSIGLVAPDVGGFLVTVSDNPRRTNGHPLLHLCLAACLRNAGVSAPKSE